jgi:HD-GYP domain-containing protein (c-di-GMP phosphodiesterase class II)
MATDIGTGRPMESALRSCLLAVRLGEMLGLGEDELRDVYYLVLLRFAGCTADSHLAAMAFGDEIGFQERLAVMGAPEPAAMMRLMLGYVGTDLPPLQRARSLAASAAFLLRDLKEISAGHCEVAQKVSGRLGMGARIRDGLGQVFERWDGKGLPRRLKGENIALPVRVIQLAQSVEALHRLGGVGTAVAATRERAGKVFDPELARRFCKDASGLFETLEVESIWDTVLDAEPGARPRISEDQVEAGTRAIADFVDLKSPYTVGHSSGVAELAAAAAELYGLPQEDIVAVRRAGYLHDLGRVGISAGIWGKPGPLTEGEWERVRLHPYYTERILARSESLSSLGALGGLHHERLDSSGYHRGLPAAMLPATARILAAADVYHAMTESRPHREARDPQAAAEELRREVRAGKIDSGAAEAVLAAAGHRVRPKRRSRVAGLTDREVEVLSLLARGLSNKEMAERLVISRATVDHHIRHIYQKAEVSTRAAATLFAMQHDLIQGPTGR